MDSTHQESQFLSPAIAKAMPMIALEAEMLMKKFLIEQLKKYTNELCEGDPELAEKIMDGEKSLAGCINHVVDKAGDIVVKQMEATPEHELNQLPHKEANGMQGIMFPLALSSDDVFGFARDYYYSEPEVKDNKKTPANTASKAAPKKGGRKKNTGSKDTGKTEPAPSGSTPAPDKGTAAADPPVDKTGQISFADLNSQSAA